MDDLMDSEDEDGGHVLAHGGNRQIRRYTSRAKEPAYSVKDSLQKDKAVQGPTVGEFVTQFLDWKAMTNASDKAANLILQMYNKQFLKCKHYLPKTWKLIHRIASPRDA